MPVNKTANALYTNLSAYYDLMCADIDYQAQSSSIQRLHQLFGNNGKTHLDLACGTGPHIQHFIENGYTCRGLDLNQPMLDIAKQRCPEAQFTLQNMCEFKAEETFDLITCFLYSIHYSGEIKKLQECIANVHTALNAKGVFFFNAVDKNKIDNTSSTTHTASQNNSYFVFSSRWHYCGKGEKQALKLSIEKTTQNVTQTWQDEHPMVAVSFDELQTLLQPLFEVHIFEHDYDKIVPLNRESGNAIFICVKI